MGESRGARRRAMFARAKRAYAEDRADPAAGLPKRIGDYEVRRMLGFGGMGVVYVAYSEALQRELAIKRILGGRFVRRESRERFDIEARAAARLRHPNIVRVHGAGDDGDGPFIVMDLVEGETLAARISTAGRLDPRAAATIALQLADALAHAHMQRVLHRDLKPANILIAADGRPVITDFGLAKLLDPHQSRDSTRTRGLLGTPAYMSPEQVRGAAVDVRTDVYGLGATLHEMLSGAPPFAGETPQRICHAVEESEPKLLRPPGGRDLGVICRVCLEKEPGRRYDSAQALADDLRRFLDGLPTRARPPSVIRRAQAWTRRRRATFATLAGALALAALALQARVTLEEQADHARARASQLADEALSTALEDLERGLAAQIDQAGKERNNADPARALHLAESLGDALAPLASDDEALLDVLSQTPAVLESAEALGPSALRAVAAGVVARNPRTRLLARGYSELSRCLQLAGNEVGAARARARGAEAYLEQGRQFAARGDLRLALGVFRALSERPIPQRLRAQALLGAGEAALRLGLVPEAGAVLNDVAASPALGPAERSHASWLTAVNQGLAGRVTTEFPASALCAGRFSGRDRFEVALIDYQLGVRFAAWNPGRSAFEELAAAPELRFGHGALVVEGADRSYLVVTCGGPDNDKSRQRSVELVGLSPGGVERLHRWDLSSDERARLRPIAVGDVDGDEKLDLLVRSNGPDPQHRRVLLFRDVLGAKPPPSTFASDGGSYYGGAAVADFDGDGRNEVVLAVDAWKRYELTVRRTTAGGPFETVFVEKMGTVFDLWTRERRGGVEALFCRDRNSIHDPGFGPGGDPHLPDAVLRLTLEEDGYRTETLHAAEFADRDRVSFGGLVDLSGLLGSYPDALGVIEHRWDEAGRQNDWLLVLPEDERHEPLRILLPRSHGPATADLDHDGDDELLFIDAASRLNVFGLSALAETPTAPASSVSAAAVEPSGLLVALDLLAGGFASEAIAELEAVIDDPSSPVLEREGARRTLWTAIAASGDLHEASRVNRALAGRVPHLGGEALLQAAACSEAAALTADSLAGAQAAFADALADLRLLERQFDLPASTAQELTRRLGRLEPLADFRPELRVGARSLADEGLPLRVLQPLQLKPRDGRLELLARNDARSGLELPLRFDGSSFRLSLRVRIEALDWASQLEVRLSEDRAGPPVAHTMTVSLCCGGGGSAEHFWRHVRFDSNTGRQASRQLAVDDLDPSHDVVVDLLYIEADARVILYVEHAGERRQRMATLGHRLPAGRYRLRLGYFGDRTETGMYGAFHVDALELHAPPGTFRPGATSSGPALVLASRWFAAGEPARALKVLAAAEADGADGGEAALLSALCHARLGRREEALGRLEDLDEGVYGRVLFGFGDEELDLLAEAFRRRTRLDASELAAEGLRAAKTEAWSRTALALHAAGEAGAAHAAVLGQAWIELGAFERAARLLDPLARKPTADAALLLQAGRAAYRRQRYAAALELWDRLPAELPPEEAPDPGAVARARRVAARGAQRAR